MKWRRCGITYSVSKCLHFLKAAGFQSPDSEVAWVKTLVTEGKTEELMFFPIVWEVTPLWTIRFLFILFRSREKVCFAFVPPKEFLSGFIKLLWSCCDCLVPWDVSGALEVYITHIEKRQKNLIQHIDDFSLVTCASLSYFVWSYHALDLLWKLWLVKSIQSIYNSMWSWYDNPISVADIGLSCWVESLPSFQAPCLCSALQLLQTQRKASSFADCLKRYNKTIIDFWFSHDIMNYQILCLCFLPQPNQMLLRPQHW